MNVWNSMTGMVELSVTSAYPTGSLQAITDLNVCVFDVKIIDAFTVSMRVQRKDISKIRALCKKRGERLEISGLLGAFYYLLSLVKRPVLILGISVWLVCTLYLPQKILFVQVSGNASIPDAYILEAAADCGILFGATGKDVRSESVKNALLSKIPQLQWAGVNTNGCVATICVREKSGLEPATPLISKFDLVAKENAIVRSVTVTKGTALCSQNQAVKKGDTLISPYRDTGLVLEHTGAQGEVYGDTKHQLQVLTPLQWSKRTEVVGTERKFSLIIGKKTINFNNDSGILEGSCVKMKEKWELKLPGGFSLPVMLVVQDVIYYNTEPVVLEQEDCIWLSDYADNYLKSNMVAGEILTSAHQLSADGQCAVFIGTYHCREMIAQFLDRESNSHYGENS